MTKKKGMMIMNNMINFKMKIIMGEMIKKITIKNLLNMIRKNDIINMI